MLGEILIKLRQSEHISQYELASDLHINMGTYYYYEKNKLSPDYDMLKKISNYYHVSIDYILGMNEKTAKEIRKAQSQRKYILKTYDSLSPKSKLELEEYVDLLLEVQRLKAKNLYGKID
jgi:transcriptional regulator with XRE-family HTH domain